MLSVVSRRLAGKYVPLPRRGKAGDNMLGETAVGILNHLLAQSGWAPQRLVPYAGMAVRFNLFPLSFACRIEADGTLHNAGDDTVEDARLTLLPTMLPLLALQDEAVLDQVERSGNEQLVAEVLYLARNLRWDAAEDLSRFTGDIAAERIVQTATGAHRHVRDSALNLLQALAEYWTEERPLIAKPLPLHDFADQVSELQAALERLERRVQALGSRPDQSS